MFQQKQEMAEMMCMDMKSEMMSEMGSGMPEMMPEDANMDMSSGSGSGAGKEMDDNMSFGQAFMSMGWEDAMTKKCTVCAMNCMEEGPMGEMKPEGEYGYGDKPEGEYDEGS